jgi:hypothetical protein
MEKKSGLKKKTPKTNGEILSQIIFHRRQKIKIK